MSLRTFVAGHARSAMPLAWLIASLALPGLGACNGDGTDDGADDGADGGTDGGGDEGGGQTTFPCSDEECALGSQYCLISYVNEEEAVVLCVDLPAGCGDCECANDDAPAQFPTTNNCSQGAILSCAQSNEEITVECYQSF